MNATKDTPTPDASADPTRGAFRQWAALWAVAALAMTAVPAGLAAADGQTGTELASTTLDMFVNVVSVVAVVNLLVMLFGPKLARRTGLPAIGGNDERESHIAGHAFAFALAIGVISTMAYGYLFDEPGVNTLSTVMVAAFFIRLVWLNRKV